jgi:hypothetical protein
MRDVRMRLSIRFFTPVKAAVLQDKVLAMATRELLLAGLARVRHRLSQRDHRQCVVPAPAENLQKRSKNGFS